jgi:hypothetical protein
LYKLIIAIVNNPAINPTIAKVTAVIFIALPPVKKKEVRVDDFPCSSSFFAPSNK